MLVLRGLLLVVSLTCIVGNVIPNVKYGSSVSKRCSKGVDYSSDHSEVQHNTAKDVNPIHLKLKGHNHKNQKSKQYLYPDETQLNDNSDPGSKPIPTPTPVGEKDYEEYPSLPYPTAQPDSTGCNLDYNAMLDQVNNFRKRNYRKPLTYNPLLTKAAQLHSEDQAKHKTMSHTGSDGSTPGKRVDRVRYDWRGVAENVAWNQRSVTEVMTAWINSPGHRANLLGDYVHFGMGCKNYYWTQVFATPA